MTLGELSEIARTWWGVWLMLLFLGIVGRALWPSSKNKRAMRDNAMIPFRDDGDSAADTETR